FDTFGAAGIIINPGAEVWSKSGPLALGDADESAIIAGRRRPLAGIGGIIESHRVRGIDIALAVAEDVRAIEQIKSGQPGSAAVNRVFDCADAVLILRVNVVEDEIYVGFAT